MANGVLLSSRVDDPRSLLATSYVTTTRTHAPNFEFRHRRVPESQQLNFRALTFLFHLASPPQPRTRRLFTEEGPHQPSTDSERHRGSGFHRAPSASLARTAFKTLSIAWLDDRRDRPAASEVPKAYLNSKLRSVDNPRLAQPPLTMSQPKSLSPPHSHVIRTPRNKTSSGNVTEQIVYSFAIRIASVCCAADRPYRTVPYHIKLHEVPTRTRTRSSSTRLYTVDLPCRAAVLKTPRCDQTPSIIRTRADPSITTHADLRLITFGLALSLRPFSCSSLARKLRASM